MKDYYSILGVIPTAELASIKGAFQGLAKKYHPDKFEGHPEEAHLKMSEINEAWSVLSEKEKRFSYDQQRDEPQKVGLSEKSLTELKILGITVDELPEISLSEISWEQICLCEFQLTKVDAIKLFQNSFEKLAKDLPDNLTIESIITNTKTILIPFIFASGNASAEWNAIGALVDEKEVNCTKCRGTGETGNASNKKRCPICRGSGSKTLSSSKKYTENGSSSATLIKCDANFSCELDFNITLSKSKNSNVSLLSTNERSYIKCLLPKIINEAEGKARYSTILIKELENTVKEELLGQYSEVENIQIKKETLEQSISIFTYLHPVYVCWYEYKGKKYFAVCDAVSGSINMPDIEPVNKGWQTFIKIFNIFSWKSLKKILVLFLLLLIALVGIGIFVEDDNVVNVIPESSESAIQAESLEMSKLDSVKSNFTPNTIEPNSLAVLNESMLIPSFDCNKATSDSEKLICFDEGLANLDNDLDNIYQQALFKSNNSQALRENAKSALQWRDSNCHDKDCLTKWYMNRKHALMYDNQQEQAETNAIDNNEIGNQNNNTGTPKCSAGEMLMRTNGC